MVTTVPLFRISTWWYYLATKLTHHQSAKLPRALWELMPRDVDLGGKPGFKEVCFNWRVAKAAAALLHLFLLFVLTN